MAELAGNLWEFNLCRVVVVDVSDDYLLMQPPLPSELYPVLREIWIPRHSLSDQLVRGDLVSGYLYDWHESLGPLNDCYVGVVSQELAVAGE